MPLPLLLVYLLSLAAVAASCWQALKLAKAFRLYFLPSYLGYLVVIGIVFILNSVVTDLSTVVLRDIPPQGMVPVYILFGLVAFPLFAIAWYFALSFVTGILDEELSPPLQIAYVLLWAVLFVIFLMRVQSALSPTSLPPPARILNRGSGLIAGVIPIAIFTYFLARAARRPRSEERSGLMTIGAVSLAGYILWVAAILIPQVGLPIPWAAPLLLGVSLLSPVLVLRDFLSRCYRPILPETLEGTKLSGLVVQCGLSRREGEILSLLLRGKSNKEIEKDLFISPHTVRNHIHNIYQKLGVGSRLQLMNFVRTRFERKDPGGR